MSRDIHNHWRKGLVSIVIPVLGLTRPRNWRRPLSKGRGLAELLDDIDTNVAIEHEVIIVCNSWDESPLVETITRDERVDKFCLNSVNVGVARAWNMGAMLAEGEFLCYSNDDVEIGPGSIEALVDVLADDRSVGQAGPRGAMWPDVSPGEYVGESEVEEADAISGFFFMTPRRVFDEVGGFDVAFTPVGCEEIDYSFAVRQSGYRCLVVPGLDIAHHGHAGVSSRKTDIPYLNDRIGTKELSERNLEILRNKWSDDE